VFTRTETSGVGLAVFQDGLPMAESKQLALSWKSGLAIFLGALLLGLLFNYLGKQAFERPTGFSILIVIYAVAMKWELRRHIWFWTITAIFVVLHVVLILFIPWPSGWIPAIVMLPFALADLYVMRAVFDAVEKFAAGPKTAER
jgi:hypothetical protein